MPVCLAKLHNIDYRFQDPGTTTMLCCNTFDPPTQVSASQQLPPGWPVLPSDLHCLQKGFLTGLNQLYTLLPTNMAVLNSYAHLDATTWRYVVCVLTSIQTDQNDLMIHIPAYSVTMKCRYVHVHTSLFMIHMGMAGHSLLADVPCSTPDERLHVRVQICIGPGRNKKAVFKSAFIPSGVAPMLGR